MVKRFSCDKASSSSCCLMRASCLAFSFGAMCCKALRLPLSLPVGSSPLIVRQKKRHILLMRFTCLFGYLLSKARSKRRMIDFGKAQSRREKTPTSTDRFSAIAFNLIFSISPTANGYTNIPVHHMDDMIYCFA